MGGEEIDDITLDKAIRDVANRTDNPNEFLRKLNLDISAARNKNHVSVDAGTPKSPDASKYGAEEVEETFMERTLKQVAERVSNTEAFLCINNQGRKI